MQTLFEFLSFLRYRRKFWLWPLAIMLVLIGVFVVAAQSTVLGPLIYSLF
jgi:hypothetical protein